MGENWDEPDSAPSTQVPNSYQNSTNDTYHTSHYNRGGNNTSRNRESSSYWRVRGENDFRGNRSRGSRPRGDTGGSFRGQMSGYGAQNNNYNRERNSKTIYVPSNKVGMIIGRGGSKISDLQYESEAKIKINKSSTDETEVILNGGDEAIAKAEQLITDLIEDKPPPAPKPTRSDNSCQAEDFSKEYMYVNEYGVRVIDWNKLNAMCDQKQKERWDQLPPIVKNFYKEDPAISTMPISEVNRWRKANNDIQVKRTFENNDGLRPIPNPVLTFEQAFKHYPEILDVIYKQGFKTPSPIQSQSWPVLLSGEDMIGIAQTGTGKTLAFILPALIHINGQVIPREEREGPCVLVIAPTRELALQIEKEVSKYLFNDIKSVCLYGGGDRKEQIKLVDRGVDIVIATPGRLNDLILARHLNIINFSYIVLDEADRMLDMGFEPQIRKSLIDVRPDRQTVMTSATWPTGVRRLAESYMNNPIQVNVGSLDLAAVHTVTHQILIVEEEEKDNLLYDFINQMESDDKVIVFCGKKATARDISTNLAVKGINCQAFHGDQDQSDREAALEDMMDGTVNILIATDVASRGLDIKDLTHVVNLDFPKNLEEYVHRVGRTGRAGKTGIAISFLTRRDWGNAGDLIKILEEASQEVPDELRQMAQRFEAMKQRDAENGGRGGRRGGRGGRGGRRGDASRWW